MTNFIRDYFINMFIYILTFYTIHCFNSFDMSYRFHIWNQIKFNSIHKTFRGDISPINFLFIFYCSVFTNSSFPLPLFLNHFCSHTYTETPTSLISRKVLTFLLGTPTSGFLLTLLASSIRPFLMSEVKYVVPGMYSTVIKTRSHHCLCESCV